MQGIANRFNKYGSTVYLLYELIPPVIDITVKDIIEQYQDDLTMKIFYMEKWNLCQKTIVHPPLLRL